MTEEHGKNGFGGSEGSAPFFPAPSLEPEANDDAYRDLDEVLGRRQFGGAINMAGSSSLEFEQLRREREELNKEGDSLKRENEALKKENETLKTESENLKNQLAAARADLYNYRQRTERERLKTLRALTLDRIGDFLPVLDNLDRALSAPEDGTARDVLVGVRMVQRQFLSILEDAGVTPVPAEGHPFDPALHDAIETEAVDDPGQDGMILRELSRGYRSSERVLRVARVRVGYFEKESEPETE
jgi:molecular chaperone GrpE